MTGTEMPGAKSPVRKKKQSRISRAGILHRMQQTTDFLFRLIQKTEIFAAVNYFVSWFKIFAGKCGLGITLQYHPEFSPVRGNALCAPAVAA